MNLSLVIALLTAILVQQVSSSHSIGTGKKWISFLHQLLSETNPHEWTPINFDLRAYSQRGTPTALEGIEFQITNAHRNTTHSSNKVEILYSFNVQSQFKMIENKSLKVDSGNHALIKFYDFLNDRVARSNSLFGKSVGFDSVGVLHVYVPNAMKSQSDSKSQSDFVTRFRYFYKRNPNQRNPYVFEFNIILTRDGSTQITVLNVYETDLGKRAVYSEKQRGNQFTAKIGTGETSTTLLFKQTPNSIQVQTGEIWERFLNDVTTSENPKPFGDLTFKAYTHTPSQESPEGQGIQLEIQKATHKKIELNPLDTRSIYYFDVYSYEFSILGDQNAETISVFNDFVQCFEISSIRKCPTLITWKKEQNANLDAILSVEYPVVKSQGVVEAKLVFGPQNVNGDHHQPWTVAITITFDSNAEQKVSINMEKVKIHRKSGHSPDPGTNVMTVQETSTDTPDITQLFG